MNCVEESASNFDELQFRMLGRIVLEKKIHKKKFIKVLYKIIIFFTIILIYTYESYL
jgi:hypothetical protein